MFNRLFVVGFAFVVLSGQVQATENTRHKKPFDSRNNVSQQTVNENKVPTPSEMEKLSRAEIKKKLEELDAERKRNSNY